MNTASILCSFGAVTDLIRALPQLVKLLRAGHAYVVSADTAATSFIVSSNWTISFSSPVKASARLR